MYHSDHYGTKPLEALLPALVEDPVVSRALEEEFGAEKDRAVAELLMGDLSGEGGHAHDVISDLLSNEHETVEVLYGLGYAGAFPISIERLGPAIWIQAVEFDPIGYFDTVEEALEVARGEYDTAIARLEESQQSGEPDPGLDPDPD
jgi:hypothetical protein